MNRIARNFAASALGALLLCMATLVLLSARACRRNILIPAVLLLLLLLVIVMALNLRPILTSIGPLLEPMRASTGLGYQQAALLTALPVLCMGLVPLLQPWLRRWVSEHGGMLGGLTAIALACLWRLQLNPMPQLGVPLRQM